MAHKYPSLRFLWSTGLLAAALTWLPATMARAGGIPRALVGRYVSSVGSILELRADGTIVFGADRGRYWVNGNQMTMQDARNGQTMTFTYRLTGNTLTLYFAGHRVVFVRQGSRGPGGTGSRTPTTTPGWGPPANDPDDASSDEDADESPPMRPHPGVGRGQGTTTTPPGPVRGATTTITMTQALRALGRPRRFKHFALSTAVPVSWNRLGLTRGDPDGILLFGKTVHSGSQGGRFTFPIVVCPYLRLPARGASALSGALSQWLRWFVAPKVLAMSGAGRTSLRWQAPRFVLGKGARGQNIGIMAMNATDGDMMITTYGVITETRGHAVILGTGLATSQNVMNMSDAAKRAMLAAFTTLGNQLGAVAAVATIRLGRRDCALERRLERRGGFYYYSRAAFFNSGINGGSSYQTSDYFRVRLFPGHTCIVESSSAGRAGFVRGGDAGAAAAHHGSGPNGAAHWEIRRGLDGRRHLAVFRPLSQGGTGLYLVETRGSEKCGDRVFHGLAIDGHVEGEYVNVNGQCTRKRR